MQRNKYFLWSIILTGLIIIMFSCNLVEESENLDEIDDTENTTEVIKKDETPVNEDNQEVVATDYEYNPPIALAFNNEKEGYLKDIFKPIGWSDDNKFAYITEFADEACGCYSLKLEIQDMQTNRILWTWSYNDDGAGETLKQVWDSNYNEIKQNLNKYKIQQSENIELKPLTFIHNKHEVSILLETTTATDPDFGFEVIKSGDIVIESSGKKHKAYHFQEEDPSFIIGTIAAGHIKSQQDDLIGVIFKKIRRGYEGPPHVVTYSIAGCKLNL